MFSNHRKPGLLDLEDWEWDNHVFAMYSIIYELCNAIKKNPDTLLKSMCSLYDIDLRRFQDIMKKVKIEKAPDSCKNFKDFGSCKFGDTCFVSQGHKACTYHLKGYCRRGKYCPYHHSK